MPQITYSGLIIPVTKVHVTEKAQTPPSIRQGPSGRTDREGLRQYLIQSLHKGLGVLDGNELVAEDTISYQSNQGLMAYQPFGLYLPYALTTQASLTATDISGIRAANLRCIGVNTPLGQSNARFYLGVAKKLYRNTSDSNAALADSTLSLTDNILSMFMGKVGSSDALIITTDGATNDASYTTDPTATPPSLPNLFAYTAGDWSKGLSLNYLGPGVNVYYGLIGSVGPGWFYTKHSDAAGTAPRQVVITATKNVPSATNTAITTSATAPGVGYNDSTAGDVAWSSAPNILASDNSRATAAVTNGVTETSQYLVASNFGFSVPSGARILGAAFAVEAMESSDTLNAFYNGTSGSGVFLVLAGAVKTNLVRTDASELTQAEATDTFGSSTDPWAGLDAGDVTDPGFGCAVRLYFNAPTASGTAGVDSITCTLTYRPPGSHLTMPSGGWILGEDPANPNTVYVIAPRQNQTGGVTVPRDLYKVVFSYEAEGDRVTGTITKINTGLNYIEAACFSLGGVVVAGDTVSGIGKSVKLIKSDNSVADLNFNSTGQGYTEAWGIVNLWGSGRILLADVALEAATVVQTWLHFDGTWHPISPRETITALPIAYGSNPEIGTHLRQRYRVMPNSTNTDVTRSFQPRSLFLNPLTNDTTEVKADGVMTITLPDMDCLGPQESDKMLLTATCFSRDVSSTNTVRLEYSTDDGSNWTTWTTFTAYGGSSTLSSPVSFRRATFRIGLNHTASGAGTPNGLPILIEGVSEWPKLRTWTCELDPTQPDFLQQFPGGADDLWNDLEALDPINTLEAGTASVSAMWRKYQLSYVPADQPIAETVNLLPPREAKALLVFEEVV